MKMEVRITGQGGQGVVITGQILGRAAVRDGKNAVQTQSYGAEARGSIAKSETIISDRKIGFPAVRESDVLVAMSQEALTKYWKNSKKDSVLIVDSTNVKTIPKANLRIYKIPFTEEAERTFKAKIYGNMVMLGALTKIMDMISTRAIERAIEDSLGKADAINKKAFNRGRALVK